MARRRASSGLALAAAALGAAACCRAFGAAFLAGGRARGRAAGATRLRVNLFEGLNFGPVGDILGPDPDEANGIAQRFADESQSRLVECSLPLGVEFEEREKGAIFVVAVEEGSDAWGQGVRPGAQVVMISATFGDEMWTTRNIGMTQFYQTLNSRFGATCRLALEREDQAFLRGWLQASAADVPRTPADEAKVAVLAMQFEAEEAALESKNMWSIFR